MGEQDEERDDYRDGPDPPPFRLPKACVVALLAFYLVGLGLALVNVIAVVYLR